MTLWPRLHPQSYKELRQLVLLHGAENIIQAVRKINDELVALEEGKER